MAASTLSQQAPISQPSRSRHSSSTLSHSCEPKDTQIRTYPRWTKLENFLLILLVTLVPSAVSGGINFAIAHIMYHKADLVRFWPFPNTIAGDLVVTTFIQGTITYVAFGATLSADIRRGSRVPWSFGSAVTPSKWVVGKYPRFATPKPPSSHDILDFQNHTFPDLRERFINSVFRGILCSLGLCLVIWPISVAILAPMYGGARNMAGTFIPQIIKGVYGFVLSVVETPLVAFIVMNGLALEQDQLPVLERGDDDEKVLNSKAVP